MSKIKIGIVEDEAIIADTIAATLDKLGYESIEPCATYTEALEMILADQPDLILLDIQLAGKMSGIQLAEKIRSDFNIPFIFLTSNSDAQTLGEAKLTRPDGYLVKPFNKNDLYTAIEVALFKHQETVKVSAQKKVILKDSLFLKEEGNLIKILISDISFFMSDHVYVEIHTSGKRHIVRTKLEEIVEKLPETFIQVHRRYVVNLDKIDSIGANHVLIGGMEIPISKSHKDDFLKTINRI